jgi:DNA-binding NtrC family response regulator
MKILTLDDDPAVQLSLKQHLQTDHELFQLSDVESAQNLVEAEPIDAALIDIHLKGQQTGLDFLKWLNTRDEPLIPVMISSVGDEETVLEAFQQGASDYIQKPLLQDQLAFLILKLKSQKAALRSHKILSRQQHHLSPQEKVPALKELESMISKVRGKDIPVLITGETGVGKEITARKLWFQEEDNSRPFVAINCAALPEHLIESELFGHEKGAFSGAVQQKVGLIELANGGDLFLDELSSLPLNLQGKLLRVLQDQTIRPLGGTRSKKISFRCLAASNEDLEEKCHEKLFREDLLHRVRGLELRVPPLRERMEELEPLLMGFFKKYSGKNLILSKEVLKVLQKYSWPGNIRELEHCARTMVLFEEDGEVKLNSLPERLLQGQTKNPKFNSIELEDLFNEGLSFYLQETEKQCLKMALTKSKNASEAAKLLKMARGTLEYKLRKYSL